MLWSKVKTVFIIIFLVIDAAFLALMGITSAESGLSADELTEIVALCDRYGIAVEENVIPTMAERLPVLEARFLRQSDLPEEVRSSFSFDETGTFTYRNSSSALLKSPPADQRSARRLVLDALKSWGIDTAGVTVTATGDITARAEASYQGRTIFNVGIDFVLCENGILSAEGRWLGEITVTQGAELMVDAPTVLAELVEEDALCHNGVKINEISIGFYPESENDGVTHKIFPTTPSYRIGLSNGETRIFSGLEE